MTKGFWFVLLWMAIGLLMFGCADRDSSDSFDGTSDDDDQTEDPTIVISGIDGYLGDIEIRITLNPADGQSRRLTIKYQGACAGTVSWFDAISTGAANPLLPGNHELVWHSWDQEAGCAGEVRLRIDTDRSGESAESEAFLLDNTHQGLNGFYESPLEDQGINDEEAPVFDRALDALLTDPTVDFVATRFFDTYEVHAARGAVVFSRQFTRDGYEYVIEQVEGENPIARQDPTWIPTYGDELAQGNNPNNITIPDKGYRKNDPRLSFIEPEDDSYPFGYERIAAFFDHPDSADFMINWVGYAHGDLELGEHGSMNISQSRCPLVFWGAGVKSGAGAGQFARQIDIAPTVAKLLGFDRTYGVDERGIWSHNVYLERQDGHPIDAVLSGEPGELVILIASDGLAQTELLRQIDQRPGKVPNLIRLVDQGAMLEYGSTTNWPSVTYPSHNVVGSGIYSGHHGLVDNEFYYRDRKRHARPISQLVFTDSYWNPIGPGETLHEAIHRNFGRWNRRTGEGAFTASLLNPSVHGADKADIEFRDRSREVPFPPLTVPWPPEIPSPDLLLLPDFGVFGEELLVQMAMVELHLLYNSQNIGVPKYVIMNNMTTDAGGHTFGPHGDKMNTVMENLDANLGVIFDWLDEWGLTGDATIILTADHGMQLGDSSRSGWPVDSLIAADIKMTASTWLGVYLAVPVVRFNELILPLGEESRVKVEVFDEDDDAPVIDAVVFATDGVSERTAFTDFNGRAEFFITPIADVNVTVTHGAYNTRESVLKVMEEAR